ncbi:hypothetical protein KEM09_02300 [Carboxylicivirga mesophila]|uniref:DUF4926 domain-containing protein n=1 Tax=Carboxylicivirga mesophila TaxID=1166478 RepID=A0ABS5K5L8_9BACT|nr:hypothetical protein [Carboxylicivirga mesophila]MBS2210212.1 hypothetical protein [Carboxylicivirga mesophila]
MKAELFRIYSKELIYDTIDNCYKGNIGNIIEVYGLFPGGVDGYYQFNYNTGRAIKSVGVEGFKILYEE